ncbi:MAG: dienelactone hydrolase family protein [Gammaproteobacteria bacterium]
MHNYRFFSRIILATSLLLLDVGCNGLWKQLPQDKLVNDAREMPKADLAGSGRQRVDATRVKVLYQGESLKIVLYKPARLRTPAPAVVFLPGRMATDDQYESYARALASRGFVVAVRSWYSLFRSDLELAYDAKVIADWLVRDQGVDAKKIGIAGHSMGGKDAVLAAAKYGGFASVVAIDPDDNGKVSVVHGLLASLKAPLLLIGAEVGWRASRVCAPLATNYQRFFERAPAGTVELTLRDADHVQMLDEPDRFGYGICRCGTADSRQVLVTARRATVSFFLHHLQGGPALPKPTPGLARIRVVKSYPITEKLKARNRA